MFRPNPVQHTVWASLASPARSKHALRGSATVQADSLCMDDGDVGTNVDGVFACVRCLMGVLLLATGVIVLLFPGVTVLGVLMSKVCCWFGVVGSCVARRYALRPAFVGSTVVFCTILSKTCVRPGGVATKSVSALKELFARTKCRLSGLRCPLDGDGVSLALPLAPVCMGDSLVAL